MEGSPLSKIWMYLLIDAALIGGCSPLSGKERQYSYSAPELVAEANQRECDAAGRASAGRAAAAADLPSDTAMTTPGVLFGAIGAIVTLAVVDTRVRNDTNDAYERAVKKCLSRKGYAVQTSQPETPD